jgi:hypothetical protein
MTLLAGAASNNTPQLVSAKRIWDAGQHNAFTDLTRFDGKWFCTFRESRAHVGGNGKIRVLTSADGERWESAALLSEEGIDLRDPKLSVTPSNRLMLVLGGSVYDGKTLKERQSRVAFSANGRDWSSPQRVLEKGDWLWRVTWHSGHAYGIAYNSMGKGTASSAAEAGDWTATLVESDDGVAFRLVAKLEVPGHPNEATVRFRENGDCVALLRREGLPGSTDNEAWIGVSQAPYKRWSWHPAGLRIGGPDFLVLPGGAMIASGRQSGGKPAESRTFVGRMDLQSVTPELILPSGGDCSYAGMVLQDDLLWMSYYSSHEGKTSIYLAKVRLPAGTR